jgi:SpoVK/Ycf46/Vps4 family AAA+-type ATPase
MEEGDRGGPTITTSETKEEKVLPTLNELSMKEALSDRDEGGLEMASNALPENLPSYKKSFTSSTPNCEEGYCGRINNRIKHNRTSSVGSIETENEQETILAKAHELFTKAKVADRDGVWEEAMKSYRSASKRFIQRLKYEKTDEKKHDIHEFIITCIERSDVLEYLIKEESELENYSGGIGSASTNESSADNDDDEKKRLRKSLESAIIEKKPNVKWDDIAGLTAAKRALQQAIIFPKRFPQLNVEYHKGILLYGPPGTGKTHLARAVATEVDSPFYSISSSDLLSKWQGESEQKVRELFNMAREEKGVIFFDEIDALCSSRTEGISMKASLHCSGGGAPDVYWVVRHF